MLCIAGKSTALRLSEGRSAGVIHIEAGVPIHAVWDDRCGEEAFYRMLGVKKGLFHTAPLPPDLTRTLHGDWQHLMIEGLRRLDEAGCEGRLDGDRSSLRLSFGDLLPLRPSAVSWPEVEPDTMEDPTPPMLLQPTTRSASADSDELSRSAVWLPPSSSRPAALPPPPDVTRLVEQGVQALRAGRPDEARRAWEEALRLDPDNRALELDLRKLPASGSLANPASGSLANPASGSLANPASGSLAKLSGAAPPPLPSARKREAG
jgi:hypothetical protein